MKIKLLFAIGIGLAAILPGCKKDNYEPPTSILSGRVVYNNQPLGVRSNGVQLELWQSGFQLFSKIPVFINQEGMFSASLFDGEYKLTRLRGNGPWMDNTDTIKVQVNGATTVDVPVQPHFVVRTQAFQKSGNAITATATVDKVNQAAVIERVSFYIGSTQFVDANIKDGFDDKFAASLSNLSQPVTLSITPNAALVSKGYVYARVGVKTSGVPEMVYGPVQRIQL